MDDVSKQESRQQTSVEDAEGSETIRRDRERSRSQDTCRFDVTVTDRTWAVLGALLVTLLWSSSYVLITIGLAEIPPITFAGLRYGLATLVLLPVALYAGEHRTIRSLGTGELGLLVLLGVTLYAVTQGAQFAALQYLTAATVSLMLTGTPVVVALVALPILGERPSRRQLVWMVVLFGGVTLYFIPLSFGPLVLAGLVIMIIGLLSNATGSICGRYANRDGSLSPLGVTTVSMGIGSIILLATGLTMQGLPPISPTGWVIVGWLAVVNTAIAFTIWNWTLQTLTATESSILNNTMLAQVAFLGWLVLGETLLAIQVVGLGIVLTAAILVHRSA